MVIETQYGFLVLKLLNNSQLQRRVRTHDEPLRTSTWEASLSGQSNQSIRGL